MIKWRVEKDFIFGGIQEYIFPARDQENVMKVFEGDYIYESEEIQRLVVNGRYILGKKFSSAWKRNCSEIGTIGENEVGDTAAGTGAGEANTIGAMPGIGEEVAGDKVGVELRVKRLVAGTNVSLSSNSNEITINATGGGGGGTPSDTVTSETSFGQSSNAGTATEYSRADHTHGTPVEPLTGINKTGETKLTGDVTLSEGANVTLTQTGSDIEISSTGGGGGTPSDTVTSETSFFQSANAGTATEYSRADHTHGTPVTPVTTLNSLTGGLSITAGSGISVTPSGSDIEIAYTGSGGASIDIEDEGSAEGSATTLNFTGAGVTSSVVGGVATINVPGGGSGGDEIVRYVVDSTSGAEVEVIATGTVGDIGYSVVGNVGSFTITNGAKLLGVRARVPSTSLSGGAFVFDMGTDDMGNTGFADRWMPIVQAFDENTRSSLYITTLMDTDSARVVIQSLSISGTNHIRLSFA